MTRIADLLVRQIEERMQERPLLVWLDRDGAYTGFVDRLASAGAFSAPIVAFRGSYLETLLALEKHENRLDPEPLVLHLPGHNDSTVRNTPFLELYTAGRRFERNLDTLVREAAAGVVAPDEVERFLGAGKIEFEAAEQWLQAEATRDRREVEEVLATLEPKWVFDELFGRSSNLRPRLETDPAAVQDFLHRHLGFTPEFAGFACGAQRPADLRTLTDAVACWLLTVEFVDDLRRDPVLADLRPLRTLSAPLRKASIELTRRLRELHPEVYRQQALVTEAQLLSEITSGTPDELGRIDTLSGEDTRLVEAALAALQEGHWAQARGWAETRLKSGSFWLEVEAARKREWELVLGAARFGAALDDAGRPLENIVGHQEAVAAYTGNASGARTDGAQSVDRAHRHFEELRRRIHTAQLPHASELRAITTSLRGRYRTWVDQLARDFSDLCDRQGFLPPAGLQQRTLFEQVVHPLVQRDGARCALFMVDALRYEMAAELACGFDGPGVTVHLGARLAELPTITAVGMNALAPAARDSRLVLARTQASTFGGVKCGEYTVRDPVTRVRAMAERSLENLPKQRKTPATLDLADLVDTDNTSLGRKIANHSLVVVHSREIDDSGEASLGLYTFDTWLGQLRAGVQKLRAAGISEFVITADHGFLLQDETTNSMLYNGGRERDRRYAILDQMVSEPDLTGTTLSALGYDGVEGYLRLPRDTRVFNGSARSSSTFVHGGNTLQERVIPVLCVTQSTRRTPLTRLTRYTVITESLPPLLGTNRIRVKLQVAENADGVLQFALGKDVPLCLRVPGRNAQALIRDVSGARLDNQRILMQPGGDWVEVLFALVGASAERVQVEVYHPDAAEEVEPGRPEVWFGVEVSGAQMKQAVVMLDASWHESIDDENHRKVLLHLDEYGTVSEEQIFSMLGGARAERRFSKSLHLYRDRLPFEVSIEVTASGKRYLKGKTTK